MVTDDGPLTVGEILEKVRIKELNFFDGMPIVTLKDEIVGSSALNFSSLQVGGFVQAKIDSVDESRKVVTLSLNEFVKGTLSLDHIGDMPLKTIPPKFKTIGKEIKVRVFNIEGRHVEFTKKDKLMKEKTPVFGQMSEVNKGDKLYGVVAFKTEFGFLVKSFGGVKGLLTFKEISSKYSDLKEGSLVKTYVLWNKKNSGLALTTDRKKAKQKDEGADSKDQTVFESFLPTESEALKIRTTYAKFMKASSDKNLVGTLLSFRVTEELHDNFYILKTIEPKQQKIAVLPKCLASSFGLALPMDKIEFKFEGLVVEFVHNIPIVAFKPELAGLKHEIPTGLTEFTGGKSIFAGFVDSVNEKLGVRVRFLNGVTKLVSVKDLEVT